MNVLEEDDDLVSWQCSMCLCKNDDIENLVECRMCQASRKVNDLNEIVELVGYILICAQQMIKITNKPMLKLCVCICEQFNSISNEIESKADDNDEDDSQSSLFWECPHCASHNVAMDESICQSCFLDKRTKQNVTFFFFFPVFLKKITSVQG